jgi:phage terminase small subunit
MLKNARHEVFAHGVAEGKSGRAAYKAAFPKCKKDEAADASAAKLLAKPAVRARVDELIAVAAEKAGVTIERVVGELARIGFADIRQVVSWGPDGVAVIDSAKISDDAAAAVAEVSKTTAGIRVKLYDKVGALEKLGRHLGMFKDKVEVAGAGGGPVQIDMPPNELMRRLAFLLTKPKDDGNG